MSLLDENFAVAAKLATHSAVKIKSMLRMLENYQTRIRLSNPVDEGSVVEFKMEPGGNPDDLDTCCKQKDVTVHESTLEA